MFAQPPTASRLTEMETLSSIPESDKSESSKAFNNLSTYCMFIGYARSGHSLIGALLDAHPNVIIADQLDALEQIQAGIGKQDLFQLLLHNSRSRVEQGRARGGHSYHVPGQWQGRFTTLRVIGDKKGQRATSRLREDPELLRKLGQTLDLPVKVFHVIRNPYDNIATKYLKRSRHGPVDLRCLIEEHFVLCQTIVDVKRHLRSGVMRDVYHEAMIEDPRHWVRTLCEFLGIQCPDDYVRACSKIVFSSPNKSRCDIEWSHDNRELVRTRMASIDFLSGYCFDA